MAKRRREFPTINVVGVAHNYIIKDVHQNNILIDFMIYGIKVKGSIAKTCSDEILRQYPKIKDVDLSGITPDNYQSYVRMVEEMFGKTLWITGL